MKMATVAMAFAAMRGEKFRFGFFGLGESDFSDDGDVSVQLGIEPLDTGEHQFGQLDGRKFALPKELSYLSDGSEREIVIIHAQKIFS